MGEKDFLHQVLGSFALSFDLHFCAQFSSELGTIHFGRINMKPGKPTTFSTVPRLYLARIFLRWRMMSCSLKSTNTLFRKGIEIARLWLPCFSSCLTILYQSFTFPHHFLFYDSLSPSPNSYLRCLCLACLEIQSVRW